MNRRNFVRLTSLAAAGGILNGGPGSMAAGRRHTPAGTSLVRITVKVFGGLAIVFRNDGALEVGAVKIPGTGPNGCSYAQHGVELKRIHGAVIEDATGLDSRDGAGNPLNIWDVSAHDITFAAGVTSRGITRPPDTSAGNLERPSGSVRWNDLAWMFAPTRHHTPSVLRHDWQSCLMTRVEFPGGTMSIDPPAPTCALLGVWEYRNQAGTTKFRRTIADRFTLRMGGTGGHLVLKVGGKDLVIAPDASGHIGLQLAATSHGFEYTYRLDEPWSHVTSYYELVTGAADPAVYKPIPCEERLIPYYASYKGKKQDCPACCLNGGCECAPGEQCPAAVFHEP